jgi:hypothetical protein
MPLPTQAAARARWAAYLADENTDPAVKEYLRKQLREAPYNLLPDEPLTFAIDVFTQDPADLSLDEAQAAMAQIGKWWSEMIES